MFLLTLPQILLYPSLPNAEAYTLDGAWWWGNPPPGRCCGYFTVLYGGNMSPQVSSAYDLAMAKLNTQYAVGQSPTQWISSASSPFAVAELSVSASYVGVTYRSYYQANPTALASATSYVNTYNILWYPTQVISAVAIHEMLHGVGVNHENGCVIMNPVLANVQNCAMSLIGTGIDPTNMYWAQPDDRAALWARY